MSISCPENDKTLNPMKLACYTGFANMIGDMLLYPFDTVGTRIKANTEQFLSFRQGLNQILQNEGFKGLYRGFGTVILGSFVPSVSYFLVYERLNKIATDLTMKLDKQRFSHINLLIPLLTAPIAELTALVTYIPLDIVRTRMQMNSPEYQYRGFFHGIQEIAKKEGILRMYQASHLYIVTVTVYTSLQFWLYEIVRYQFLSRRHKEESQKKLSTIEAFQSTIFSTSIASLLVNPLDVIITRFQLVDSNKQMLSSWRLVKDLVKKEGTHAFWKGFGTRLVQYNASALFYLPVYDHFKSKYGVTLHS